MTLKYIKEKKMWFNEYTNEWKKECECGTKYPAKYNMCINCRIKKHERMREYIKEK